jgi:hypothetical protein
VKGGLPMHVVARQKQAPGFHRDDWTIDAGRSRATSLLVCGRLRPHSVSIQNTSGAVDVRTGVLTAVPVPAASGSM